MNWFPDTCYCEIETNAPSKNGKFSKRCRVHATTRNTIDVYQHNIANQERQETDEATRDAKKRATRESTRP